MTGVIHKLNTLLPLAIVAAGVLCSAAVAAPSGNYKGKIEYQGYEVTFRVSKNGKVSGKRTDRFDQSKATVELNGSFKGGTFKGLVREVDFVEGSGIVCDTLERKFTAKRR